MRFENIVKIKDEYFCALLLTMDLLGGKWKLRILWHIINGDNRFSLLRKLIPDITNKMLITQLKELEESGILVRKDFKEVPLRIEYSILDEYKGIIYIIDDLCNFTKKYALKNKIKID